ncbi:MAG: uroporphyrinogen-III synthase [Methanobacterium sp.]|nr:uroporphyrinogen-III synthase [Methanobacterium sp.]
MKGNEFKGKIIGITRPAERVDEAVNIIESYGGKAFIAPTLELKVSNSQPLKNLCKMAGKLDWLIFTSPTAIISLFKHCKDLKERLNPNCEIGVIGPRTGKFLEEQGLKADIIPDDYTTEGLLDIYKDRELTNKLIGLPRTLSARDPLPDGLEKMGANILIAEAYSSQVPENKENIENLIKNIITGKIDAITFTSNLTVQNLLKISNEKDKEKLIQQLRNGNVKVAAIGPVTAQPLKELGIPVLIPKEYTVKAMLEKLVDQYKRNIK